VGYTVSRLEFAGYNFPVSGLRIQVSTPIDPGISGGPAVAGDAMIGLAFSPPGAVDNLGYLIPGEEIEFFLRATAHGEPYRKPGLFDEMQSLDNPALRAYLKAGPAITGMVVTHPDPAVPGNPLRAWDIVTRIGPVPVADDGTVALASGGRVSFRYLVQKWAVDGRLAITVYRAGQPLELSVPVTSAHPLLLPDLSGTDPEYFILGPIVFSAASAQYVAGLDGNAAALTVLGATGNPLITRRGDAPAFPGEQLVVIASPFLPHPAVEGYDDATAAVVSAVN
jgi:hypothetical protein